MKTLFKILLIATTLIMLAACSSTETIIKPKKVEITVPAIKDSIAAAYDELPKAIINSLELIFVDLPDTAGITGEKRIEVKSRDKNIGDVNVRVKYFPKKKLFLFETDEFKVDTAISDTTNNVIKKETTLAEKLGYGVIGIVIFCGVVLAIFLWVKK